MSCDVLLDTTTPMDNKTLSYCKIYHSSICMKGFVCIGVLCGVVHNIVLHIWFILRLRLRCTLLSLGGNSMCANSAKRQHFIDIIYTDYALKTLPEGPMWTLKGR